MEQGFDILEVADQKMNYMTRFLCVFCGTVVSMNFFYKGLEGLGNICMNCKPEYLALTALTAFAAYIRSKND